MYDFVGFTVQTDHVILARGPDMIVINKKTNKAQLIDVIAYYWQETFLSSPAM